MDIFSLPMHVHVHREAVSSSIYFHFRRHRTMSLFCSLTHVTLSLHLSIFPSINLLVYLSIHLPSQTYIYLNKNIMITRLVLHISTFHVWVQFQSNFEVSYNYCRNSGTFNVTTRFHMHLRHQLLECTLYVHDCDAFLHAISSHVASDQDMFNFYSI